MYVNLDRPQQKGKRKNEKEKVKERKKRKTKKKKKSNTMIPIKKAIYVDARVKKKDPLVSKSCFSFPNKNCI